MRQTNVTQVLETVTNLGIDFPLDAFRGLGAIINTQKREITD